MAREITREIAAYAVHSRYNALPEGVRNEAARAFLNWVGCALGGCRDSAVEMALAAVAEAGGSPQASVIGHRRRTDVASAAFVNCLASAVLSFDDTHLATVTHPTGPVAAALFAHSEKQPVGGEEFINALALGIEIECRMSKVILLPPAQANIGLFVTGITGPIGAAVALGRLLALDESQMRSAIGLAAAQAAGVRGTHGAMGAFFVPAHAARNGVHAALLAVKGVTGTDTVLEGSKGFVDVFGKGGKLDYAVEGLGREFELFANAYKPYPSGIVAQPAIDACLDIAGRLSRAAEVAAVSLSVHPLALELCGRRHPANPVEAQISLFHWVAATLVRRSAGLPELAQACIDDLAVAALRARIAATPDTSLARDEAIAEVTLTTGETMRSHVEHARGSIERPMTDEELDAKFLAQAHTVLSDGTSKALLTRCRELSASRDVGGDIAQLWKDQ